MENSEKIDLLKSIAETGYNVGFGAKKNFATYDIISKLPGRISVFATIFGIYALVFKDLTQDILSASILGLGVVGLYISKYEYKKQDYEKTGIRLTEIYNNLHQLYRETKKTENKEILSGIEKKFLKIRNDFYQNSISEQIFLSDWYAHYKFFWQHQISWVDEQKKFTLFRDKIPLSFLLTILASVVIVIIWNHKIIDSIINYNF